MVYIDKHKRNGDFNTIPFIFKCIIAHRYAKVSILME